MFSPSCKLRPAAVTLLLLLIAAGPALAQPSVSSVTVVDDVTVDVTFDQDIDAASASVVGRYQIFQTDTPTNTVAVSSVAVAGPTATLSLAAALTGGVNYTLRSQGIQPLGGGPASGLSAVAFDAPFNGTVIPLATIQADPASFDGQVVTVEGQVYIPSNYRGTTISGYIQDASGRGINVFGSEADVPALRDVTAVVRVTGTVTLFFSTVELASITSVQTLSTGNPPLSPQTITTGAASSSQWEGTFIEVSGTVQSSSQGGPGRNYIVDDGSGSVVVRVVDTLGVSVIGDGATLTARGAGGQFGTDFQVNVGRAADISSDGGGGGGGGGTVTPIADIQADPAAFAGNVVTVEGQVYIPTNYRGTTISGYIQDDSGRGINIFGNGADVPALEDVTAKVRLTGTVDLFFTTVEILNINSVQTLSTGNPLVPATKLTLQQANSSDWEGTYIEVEGNITSQSTAGGAANYTIAEGEQSLTVRVADTLGVSFNTGQRIYARGAGSQFQTSFQVLVGRVSDIQTSPFSDQSPPRLLTAFLSSTDELSLRFNEALEESSATEAGNYTVSRDGGVTVGVVAAFLEGGSQVRLTLAQSIEAIDGWTVEVRGLADLGGNRMSAPQLAAVTGPPAVDFVLDGPARTFLPREGETYPISVGVSSSIASGGSFDGELLLRIFDLQGRLKATLYDSRFDPAGTDFSDQNHTVQWDGRDEFAERVPAGAYIAHLRVVENTTGKTHELQMPVVVAARLEQR